MENECDIRLCSKYKKELVYLELLNPMILLPNLFFRIFSSYGELTLTVTGSFRR